MKYIVVVGDGMADRPLKQLSGKTPLEAAHKTHMDYIARNGRCGLLRTLSEDAPLGSDIANLSLLGYDPKKYHPGGRGPLEAAAMKVPLGEGDIAFRVNLVTEEKGLLKDYSGGHISSREGGELIRAVDAAFGSERINFYPGVGYRHLAVLRKPGVDYRDIIAMPPHDILGRKVQGNLIRAGSKDARHVVDELNRIMKASKEILGSHKVNVKRLGENKDPANMIWLWGGGKKPDMPKFREMFGLSGALISAVDLLRGIGACIGLEVIDVPGATGYFDTDYDKKAEYALAALKRKDFVYLHVEAPDEASHEGNIEEKIRAIEAIDEKILGRILGELEGSDFRLAVLPDHATPIEVKTHTAEPVPFAIYSAGEKGDGLACYSEKEAAKGSYGLREGVELMGLLIDKKANKTKS